MIDEFAGHLQDDPEIAREQRQSILAKGISTNNCERWAVIGGGSDKESRVRLSAVRTNAGGTKVAWHHIDDVVDRGFYAPIEVFAPLVLRL
ncbi:MAG TPA: hypothetical protein VN980_01285 [Alphaproteobacteria bacterium]|nr:hypothetical protein [Alphaproteobacteria bacterium]